MAVAAEISTVIHKSDYCTASLCTMLVVLFCTVMNLSTLCKLGNDKISLLSTVGCSSWKYF